MKTSDQLNKTEPTGPFEEYAKQAQSPHKSLKEIGKRAYDTAVANGFHSDGKTMANDPRLISVYSACLTEEVGELHNAHRKGTFDEPDEKTPEIPHGLAEISDIVLYCTNMCHQKGWDLDYGVEVKQSYNETKRPFRHGGQEI